MKKLSILLAALCLAVAPAAAKGLKGKTIYVNPGHGGWTTGDRPTPTINYEYMDTLGFFESKSNLWKGLELRKKLEEAGAKVIMSRTRNGFVTHDLMYNGKANENSPHPAREGSASAYDREETDCDEYGEQQIVGLEKIACQVDSLRPDFFISLHSNAHKRGSTVNYLVILYRGENSKAYQEPSDEMARMAYPYIWENPLSYWSHYSPEKPLVVGDITFMGGTPPGTANRIGVNGYYAVLKHRVPGYLVEGSFHTYDPERQRLLNRDYCRMEGVRYYRGIRAYFGGKPEKTGYLVGAVKSATEQMNHERYVYKEGTDDQWKPINHAMVYLTDKQGRPLRAYCTDQEWNGVFVFDNLKPGKYRLRYEAYGYQTAWQDVEVKADKTSYVLPKLSRQ